MSYTDDITIISTHTSLSAARKCIQPYLHKVFAWAKQSHTKCRQNNLHSIHSRPCRMYEQSGPQNKQHCTTHSNVPKGSGFYIRPKLTYSTQIHNISVQAHNPLQIIKALTATGWGKQKETWLPTRHSWNWVWGMALASLTSINKVDAKSNPSPQFPLCNTHIIYSTVPTYAPRYHHLILWTDPARLMEKLAGVPQARRSDSHH